MYKALSPGAIHVSVKNLDEAIAAAKIGGFEGVEVHPVREEILAIFPHHLGRERGEGAR